MASISAIRDGLKARLATISSLHTYDVIPDDVASPAAVVVPGDPLVVFDSTFSRGSDELNFIITVLVQFANERTAQDTLDAYLAGSGASSVKSAVEADGTLGGVVAYTTVTSAVNYGGREYAGVNYLAVDFTVVVGS